MWGLYQKDKLLFSSENKEDCVQEAITRNLAVKLPR